MHICVQAAGSLVQCAKLYDHPIMHNYLLQNAKLTSGVAIVDQ